MEATNQGGNALRTPSSSQNSWSDHKQLQIELQPFSSLVDTLKHAARGDKLSVLAPEQQGKPTLAAAMTKLLLQAWKSHIQASAVGVGV